MTYCIVKNFDVGGEILTDGFIKKFDGENIDG